MQAAGGEQADKTAALMGVGLYGLATFALAVLVYTGSRWATAAAIGIYILLLLAARAVVLARK